MFQKTKPNMIESDEGFSVEQIEAFVIVYREGEKRATLEIEPMSGPIAFVVYLAGYSDRWDPPFDKERLDDGDWGRIGENIRQAYRSQGLEIKYELISPEAREGLKRSYERAWGHAYRPPGLPKPLLPPPGHSKQA
jgi:hypothetical protein